MEVPLIVFALISICFNWLTLRGLEPFAHLWLAHRHECCARNTVVTNNATDFWRCLIRYYNPVIRFTGTTYPDSGTSIHSRGHQFKPGALGIKTSLFITQSLFLFHRATPTVQKEVFLLFCGCICIHIVCCTICLPTCIWLRYVIIAAREKWYSKNHYGENNRFHFALIFRINT